MNSECNLSEPGKSQGVFAYVKSVHDCDEACVPSGESSKVSEDSVCAEVSVLYGLIVEVMAPSDALDSIHKEDVVALQDEIVDEA